MYSKKANAILNNAVEIGSRRKFLKEYAKRLEGMFL